MSQTLQITDGTTTIDLISGTLQWALEGWSTASSQEGVWETLEIVTSDTDANIRSAVVSLEKLFEQARMYAEDNNEHNPVLFKWASEGETVKQTMIADGRVALGTYNRLGPMLGGVGARLTIGILRSFAWEATSATTVSASSISSVGGTVVIGADTGTLPQRISKAKFQTTTSSRQWSTLWAGIRRQRDSIAFAPNLPAGYFTTSLSKVTDTQATTGTAINFDYSTGGTTSPIAMAFLRLSSVGGRSYGAGRYLVLGRLRASSTSATALFQLWHSMNYYGTLLLLDDPLGRGLVVNDQNADMDGEIVVDGLASGTAYHYHEFGVIQIPPGGNRGTLMSASSMGNYNFHLVSQRYSSAGSFIFDTFTLIPAEHLFTAKNFNLSAGTVAAIEAYSHIDGSNIAYKRDDAGYLDAVESSFNSGAWPWEYPVRGGVLVVATDGTVVQDSTALLSVSVDLIPRWSTFSA